MLEIVETINEKEVAPGSWKPTDFSPNTLALPIFGIKSAVAFAALLAATAALFQASTNCDSCEMELSKTSANGT